MQEPAGGLREPAIGLRERKKLETYRALAAAARELTMERGLDAVTVEEIAASADVSMRTFFNYFACKEEAIAGIEPSALAEMADRLLERPAEETPLAALVAVLVTEAGGAERVARQSVLKTELVRRYPSLLPRYLASLVDLEHVLVAALAARLRVDPALDPYPTVVVSATVNVLRSTLAWWHEHGETVPLDEALGRAYGALAGGLSR